MTAPSDHCTHSATIGMRARMAILHLHRSSLPGPIKTVVGRELEWIAANPWGLYAYGLAHDLIECLLADEAMT